VPQSAEIGATTPFVSKAVFAIESRLRRPPDLKRLAVARRDMPMHAPIGARTASERERIILESQDQEQRGRRGRR
jgi:hypothetical protein